MSHVGPAVAKVPDKGKTEQFSAKPKEIHSPLAAAAARTVVTHDNGDRVQAAPPGGKNFKKPVPPPKTRAPSGVQIRKQSSTERKAPLRKQNSTSFTTEDLDLFQSMFSDIGDLFDTSESKRHDADNDVTSVTTSTQVRKSRLDSLTGKDGLQIKNDKHRSKSAEAFANRGLRPTPVIDEKPQVPTKPKPKPKVPGKPDRPVEIRRKTSSQSKASPRTASSSTTRVRTSSTRHSSRSSGVPLSPRDTKSPGLPPSGKDVRNQDSSSGTQTKESQSSARRRGTRETRIPKLRSAPRKQSSRGDTEEPQVPSTLETHKPETPSTGISKSVTPPHVLPKPNSAKNQSKVKADLDVNVSKRSSPTQISKKSTPPAVSPKPHLKVSLPQSTKDSDVDAKIPPGASVLVKPRTTEEPGETVGEAERSEDVEDVKRCDVARATIISALTAAQVGILPRRSVLSSFRQDSVEGESSHEPSVVEPSDVTPCLGSENVVKATDVVTPEAVTTKVETPVSPAPETPASPGERPTGGELTRKTSRKESIKRPTCMPPPPPPSAVTKSPASSSPRLSQSPRILEACATFEGKGGSTSRTPPRGSPTGIPITNSPRNTPNTGSPRSTPKGGSPQLTPSGSPKSGRAKLMKIGLTDKGHDVSPAKLIQDRIARLAAKEDQGTSDQSSSEDLQQLERPTANIPGIFISGKKDSPVSSDSERRTPQPQQSDSNDADDEEDHIYAEIEAFPPRPKEFVKSFSTGQKDVHSSESLEKASIPSDRAVSMVSAVSTVSSASTDSQKGKTKSKGKNWEKKNLIEGIMRKLSLGTKDDSDDLVEDWKKVGNAKFYRTEESGSVNQEEITTKSGTTLFDQDIAEPESSDKEPDEETFQEEHVQNQDEFKAPELPERVNLRKEGSKNGEQMVGSVDADMHSQTNGDVPYENIIFGQVYEGIEVRKNQAGRNDLYNSSMEATEDAMAKQQPMGNSNIEAHGHNEPIRNDAEGLDTQGSTSVDPNGNSTVTAEGTNQNLDTTKQDFNQIPTYENMEFTASTKRSMWRRKTIRRRIQKRRNRKGEEERTEEEGTYDEFENFSDSNSDFDSDSFTDEDSEFEKEISTGIYQSLEEAAPVEEVSSMSKLQRIANELLSTERAYVKRLHLIDQIFHFKVLMENRAQHMFPDDVIPQMFSNIKSIYQFHHDFLLPQLEKRMEAWDSCPKVGDLMKKFAPFLKLYSEYVKNFDHAMNIISTWQERSAAFASIMAEVQKRPECGMLTLQHHMLEPIQRVPRYELLLKDYLKHLPEDSDDHEDTKKALQLVTTAATHSNEAMRKMEKFRKLLELNEMFGGMIDLIDPSRELIKEGKMVKISARNGVHYDRYLLLFNDMLLVCRTDLIGLLHHYRIKTKLDIEGMQVLESDNLQTADTFLIKSKTKTIELLANSHDQKMEWQVTMWNVIADYTKKQMSRQAGLKAIEAFQDNQLGFRAPTWVKDQNTSMCMQCGCAFSVLRRRHHCRCCGIVVCAKCSSHKCPLPYQDNKPDRVCDKCYRTLSGRRDRAMSIRRQNNAVTRKRGVLQVKASDPSMISSYLLMSTDKKTWERRWFAVHQSFVLYSFKAPQDVHALTSMPLPGHEVLEVTKEDHIDRENIVKLFHKGQKKIYFFQAEDKTLIEKWQKVLSSAVKAETPGGFLSLTDKTPSPPGVSTC